MHTGRRGAFTLIEVLIALAVISISFAALGFALVTNLRASVSARLSSEVKAAANVVLEDRLAAVLEVDTSTDPDTYAFHDYYWSCPDGDATGPSTVPAHNTKECTGQTTVDGVDVTHDIVAGYGVRGEGFVTITVTGTQQDRGQTLTIGDRVTCYDIYPSPTVDQPEPCPEPTKAGGGWTE